MKRGSTVGRPRKLTDAQVAAVLRWHEAQRALQALHTYLRTVREFAAYLGVSRGSVTDVIKRQGVFKQACPSTKRATPAQAGGSSRR